MEDCVDQFLMELICFSGIEQGVIDVRCPVIKGREKEAKLRRRHDLPLGAAVKLIFPWEKAQLHLPVLYRADRADNVLEYLVGAVSLGLTILSPVRNIVCVMRQKDQIIALSHIQAFNHLLIKGIPGRSILQGGRAELRKQPVLRPFITCSVEKTISIRFSPMSRTMPFSEGQDIFRPPPGASGPGTRPGRR